jgi:hypothetical protein
MSELKIEAPNDADVDYIARAIIHAEQVVAESLNAELNGSVNDLSLIQRLLDGGTIDRESTYTLQSLGLAFGRVFINATPDYDWWMIDDECGRDPAVRYRESSLLFHPQTMISKRIEDGEMVDVLDLYNGLSRRLREILERGVDGA